MPSQARITLFGGLEAEVGGERVTRFRTRKAAGLLAYLAYHAERRHPREVLVEMFWPDSDSFAGRAALRNELAALRRQLEPPGTPSGAIIHAAGDRIGLSAGVETDVARCAALLEAARHGDPSGRIETLRRAADCCRGDLLAGLYDDWIGAEREAWSARIVRALCLLSELLREQGEPEEAQEAAARAVAADVLSARARRAHIEACLALARTDEALAAYRDYARTLASETGDPPHASVTALVQGLRSAPERPASGLSLGSKVPASGSVSSSPPDPPAPAAAPPFLPLYLTRFFGREAERGELIQALDASRLVTLTGPGGMGKTRLAVETIPLCAWPCVFVPLAGLADDAGLSDAILRGMGIAARAGEEPAQLLPGALRQRGGLLLALDNAEHLIEAVSQLVTRLLEASPDLRILVTSRRRLNLPGERVFPLPPLPRCQTELERPLDPAVSLFVDRARIARPDFALTGRNESAVAEICRRLEGMPLAIELAAARIAVQTPVQIAASLRAGVPDLHSRQRGLVDRHRSLRSAVQGSLDLLDSEQRAFLAALSAFRGGWTAVAAGEVCAHPEPERILEELSSRSLILLRESMAGAEMRGGFLEPIRPFAAELLGDSEREVCGLRHARFFLTLADRVTEDDTRTLLPLDEEFDNLSRALEVAREAVPDLYWRGLGGALIYAFVRGRHRAALAWMEEALAQVDSAEEYASRFRVRYGACLVLPDVGLLDKTEQIAWEIEADAAANRDAVGPVYGLVIRAYAADLRGRADEAAGALRLAVSQARELGDASLMQACLSHASGTLHSLAASLGAAIEEGGRALDEAEACARELMAITPQHSRRAPLAPLLLAAALFYQGRDDEALVHLAESTERALAAGTTTERMFALLYESAIRQSQGEHERAARLYGGFLELQQRMGYSLDRAQSSRPGWIERLAESLEASLGRESLVALLTEGRTQAISPRGG